MNTVLIPPFLTDVLNSVAGTKRFLSVYERFSDFVHMSMTVWLGFSFFVKLTICGMILFVEKKKKKVQSGRLGRCMALVHVAVAHAGG